MRLKFCVLIPMIQVNYQTHLLNPTQNHLVNSTLPIFNLSTQPSLLPSYHTPKTQKSESRKNTSISRNCFIFKPFSVFSSVLLTTILRTPHAPSAETDPPPSPSQPHTLPPSGTSNPSKASPDHNSHTQPSLPPSQQSS